MLQEVSCRGTAFKRENKERKGTEKTILEGGKMVDEKIDITKIVSAVKTSWNARHREIIYSDQIPTKEWNLIKDDPELTEKCLQIAILQGQAQAIVDSRLKVIRELGIDGYKEQVKQGELKAQMELAQNKVGYIEDKKEVTQE